MKLYLAYTFKRFRNGIAPGLADCEHLNLVIQDLAVNWMFCFQRSAGSIKAQGYGLSPRSSSRLAAKRALRGGATAEGAHAVRASEAKPTQDQQQDPQRIACTQWLSHLARGLRARRA